MRAALLLVVVACSHQPQGAAPQACGSMANATAKGISLSAIDRTGRNIDLCPHMDAALSKPPHIESYQHHGYHVVVELSRMDVTGGNVTCSLKVEIVAPASRNAIARGGAKVQGAPADVAFAIDDCTTAVIEDLFVKKIFP